MKIILGCQKEDNLPSQCNDYFGIKEVEIIKRNGILGIDEIMIIISCAQLTVEIITFLYSVLASNNNDISSDKKTSETNNDEVFDNVHRRVLITKDGDMNLEGYSFDEVEKILHLMCETNET